jgi:predicted Ser/Thr protein kinase
MDCLSCLAPLPEEARFCPKCGTAAAEPVADTDPLRETLKVALGTQYQVERLLGRGGMGAVYLAREMALDREVAIKVLPADRSASADSRERFRREARTAAKLSHPNIVPLHTFGEVDGTMYFVMGYVRGESLASRLNRERRIDPEDARRILIEVADALEYAHKLGIVHRDIKPDNVLIDAESGRAMLTDFGVAKARDTGQALTATGSLVGTPHYMSPEQAQGRADIDHRSDLYSLGVMAWAMLAGRLPFEGKTSGELLMQHITKEAPPLSNAAPDVPSEISQAVTRCLVKDPAERWTDARSFRAALTPAGEDELPHEVEQLQGFVAVFAASLLLLLYIGAFAAGGGDVSQGILPAVTYLTATLAVMWLLLPLVRIAYARKKGIPAATILNAIFLQPRRWSGWYPRRFRRAGDVWDRLPAELRRARAAAGWMLPIVLLVLIPGFIMLITMDWYSSLPPGGMSRGLLKVMVVGPAYIWVLMSIGLSLIWVRRARSLGLTDLDVRMQMLGTPTSKRSFWSRPDVAAVLTARPGGTRSLPSSASPRDYAEAIGQIAGSVPSAVRDVAARAAVAAVAAASEVEALDREVAALAGTVPEGEQQRIVEKLAALRGSPAGAMFEKQLDLIRGLESRLEEARSRRSLRMDQIRDLWQQTSALGRTEASGASAEKILAICRQISQAGAEEATIARALDTPTVKT